MPDLEQLAKHVAVTEARKTVKKLRMMPVEEWEVVVDRIIAAAVAKVLEPYKMALEAVAVGIWRDKERNAKGLAGGSLVVDLVEAALKPPTTEVKNAPRR